MSENAGHIAVVGAGVAGLTAAWLLQRKYRVTLFEKNDYLGGHTRTVVVPEGPDQGTPIDTGFIVMNHRNYPLFTRLLDELGVPVADSNMSFSFWCEATGYTYAGSDLNTLFAQRRNLFSPGHWAMIRDILAFNRSALDDLAADRVGDLTLGDYAEQGGYGKAFLDNYLLPMGAAIWSAPHEEMKAFPARAFLHFFRNHGLLSIKDRPQWKYVSGGSRTYVEAIARMLDGRAHVNSGVERVRRQDNGASVVLGNGNEESFDAVVLAGHADESLALLEEPTAREQELLGAWSYSSNETVLHTDAALMTGVRRAWSSWNVVRTRARSETQPVSVTYWMNRLQSLDTAVPYFVTLNQADRIRQEHVVSATTFTHPVYSTEAMATQEQLPGLNGVDRLYFCGSYFGYGFHEDAVRSAVQVAESLGVEW